MVPAFFDLPSDALYVSPAVRMLSSVFIGLTPNRLLFLPELFSDFVYFQRLLHPDDMADAGFGIF